MAETSFNSFQQFIPKKYSINHPVQSSYNSSQSNVSRCFLVKTAADIETLPVNIQRIYSCIYESMGGYIKWQGGKPVLTLRLEQQFIKVRQAVLQGEKIAVAMAAILN